MIEYKEMKQMSIGIKEDRQEMKTNDYQVFYNTNNPVNTDYHFHDFYEILVFISGNVNYIVEDKTYSLRPGDIILTNNSELHRPIILDNSSYKRYITWINPKFVQKIKMYHTEIDISTCFNSSSKMHYNLLKPDNETLKEIINILNKLLVPVDQAKFGDELIHQCLLLELLINLNQAHLNTTITPDDPIILNPKIRDIVYHINQHLTEPLTLDDLSNKFYISKFHLTRLFKEYTGLSLHQFILKKRLILSKKLLSDGATPYQACIDSGFNDYPHFSRCFKNNYDLSPRAYIKQIEN